MRIGIQPIKNSNNAQNYQLNLLKVLTGLKTKVFENKLAKNLFRYNLMLSYRFQFH